MDDRPYFWKFLYILHLWQGLGLSVGYINYSTVMIYIHFFPSNAKCITFSRLLQDNTYKEIAVCIPYVCITYTYKKADSVIQSSNACILCLLTPAVPCCSMHRGGFFPFFVLSRGAIGNFLKLLGISSVWNIEQWQLECIP